MIVGILVSQKVLWFTMPTVEYEKGGSSFRLSSAADGGFATDFNLTIDVRVRRRGCLCVCVDLCVGGWVDRLFPTRPTRRHELTIYRSLTHQPPTHPNTPKHPTRQVGNPNSYDLRVSDVALALTDFRDTYVGTATHEAMVTIPARKSKVFTLEATIHTTVPEIELIGEDCVANGLTTSIKAKGALRAQIIPDFITVSEEGGICVCDVCVVCACCVRACVCCGVYPPVSPCAVQLNSSGPLIS